MAEQAGFKRNIGLFMAVMIGIGAMMRPGIFALPTEVADMVGPLGIVAYLAMGILTLFTAAAGRREQFRLPGRHRDRPLRGDRAAPAHAEPAVSVQDRLLPDRAGGPAGP